ncbi:hypothetical protein EC991_008368 [Linnemannia zychae]|nr:hypothetical protein EC991_008368 [Linnemannia zychae]
MTIDVTLQHSHLEQLPNNRPVSPLAIPELLERIFSFLEPFDIAYSVVPVCRQWFFMNQHRLLKEVYWNSRLPAEELQQDLVKVQDAGRLCCYIDKEWTIFKLWNDLVEAIKEKYTFRQTSKGDRLQLRGRPSANSTILSNVAIDIQEFANSSLQELSLSGHLQYIQMFPPLMPFLGELTSLEMRLREMARLQMWQVLTACPLLERIHFESRDVLVLEDPWFVNKEGVLEEDLSHRLPLRLRSLVLFNVQFHQSALGNLISISPHLKKLKLHTWVQKSKKVPVVFGSDEFNEYEKTRLDTFWLYSTATGNDNQLQHHDISQGSTQLFLNSKLSPSILQMIRTTPNVVTTLELRRDDMNTAVGLQEYLCSSPHLLHLLAPHTELSVHNLDIYQRLPHRWIRVDETGRLRAVSRTWACRNLQTLYLAFHSYGSGRIESAIVSRIIFGYISRVCPQVRDVEIYGLDVFSLRAQEHKPSLCMRLEGGLCFLARLRHMRRLRVGSFDAKLQSTPSDFDWMVPSGHFAKAAKARKRVVAEWDSNLAKEQQEELSRLSNPDYLEAENCRRIGATVDPKLDSCMRNLGLLADVKAMLLEEMIASDFVAWPRLIKLGLYTDTDILSSVDKEYQRLKLTEDPVVAPKSRISQMFSFYRK